MSFASELKGQEPEVIHLPQEPQPVSETLEPEKDSPEPPLNVQEVLGELWFRRQGFLDRGDIAAAERQVGLMRDVVRREGLLNAEDISGAFLVDGSRQLERDSPQRALRDFQLAKEFAPHRPDPFFAVAQTLWRTDRDLSGALTAVFQGLRVIFKNPAARAAYLGSFFVILTAGSVLTAALWCLISAFRTARLAQHDLYESRARTLAQNQAHLVAWGLWVLPAIFWLSGWWILVYWLALAIAYLKRSERLVSYGACLCFLAALPVLGWVTQQSALTTDPAVRFLLEAAQGGNARERIPALEQMAAAHPGVPIYQFLLAQAYGESGSLEAGLVEYRAIQELEPDSVKAWINTGNLYFEREQYPQAAEEYKRATEADPESALAHFNLHLALQRALRLEEADEAFRRARAIDNELITSILAAGGNGGQRQPVEARYTSEEVLMQLAGPQGQRTKSRTFGEIVDPLPLAGGLGFLACLFLSWIGPRKGFGLAQECIKCGEPFCRRCQVGMRREDGYCTACRHLYVLKDPVAPRIREEREKLVAARKRWQWISRRMLSLIIPGAAQIQGGRTWLGTGILWVTCTSISALALLSSLLAYPRVAVMETDHGLRIAAIFVVALAWLSGNVLRFERKR